MAKQAIFIGTLMEPVGAPTLKSVRAGAYRRVRQGYRAFFPADLPPAPPIRVEGEMQTRLSEANIALGRLDGSIQTLPNPDLFVFMYIRKEAVLSSQIEGTQSSLHDLLAAEAKILSGNERSDVDDLVNYVAAMNYGLVRLADLPVSVRLIREIHEKLLPPSRNSKATPGELRRSQNWIGPQGCTLGEAVFVPPPPDVVPEALGALEKFLHESSDLPLLIRIGLAHAQFETIHPFLDGNGRVGRLLITFLLCEGRVLQKPVLYLSYYFKRHRDVYYRLLQATRDEGKFEEWLAFFLCGVKEVSEQAAATARQILLMREKHRSMIADGLGYAAGNGHRVLEQLFERPLMSVNEVAEIARVTYAAANNLVGRLVELGILEEITGQYRNRRFRYTPYVELFTDSGRSEANDG